MAQVRQPRHVLAELLRIADRAIVSLPNFGHWRVRLELLRPGRMPVTDSCRALVGDAQHPPVHGPRLHPALRRTGPAIEACAALAEGSQPGR